MIVNVTPIEENRTLSKNEKKITQTAILNINVLVNALLTGKGMISNPIEDDPENLGFELHFEEPLDTEQETKLSERIERQLSMFVQMSEVPYKIAVEKKNR